MVLAASAFLAAMLAFLSGAMTSRVHPTIDVQEYTELEHLREAIPEGQLYQCTTLHLSLFRS